MFHLRLLKSLRGRLTVGCVGLGLVLAWSVIGITIGTHQMQSKLSDVVQSQDAVITNIYERMKLTDDQETGLRGYLLTEHKSFLRPYTEATRTLPHLRSQGAALAGGMNRHVVSAMRKMSLAGVTWQRWAAKVLAHPLTNPRSTGSIKILLYGRSLFDRFRTTSTEALQLADRARTRDVDESQQLATDSTWFLVIWLFVALLLTMFTAWMTLRALTKPLKRLSGEAGRIGAGGLAAPVSMSGVREFDELAASMETMRMRLQTNHEQLARAYRAVAESEEKHRLLADNSGDMIARHAPDGTYLYISPICRELLGYEPEELIGHSSYEFFHPDDLEVIRGMHQSLQDLPDTQTATYRRRCKNGQYVWFETVSRPIRDPESGELIEIQTASRDTTERKAMEDAVRGSNAELEAFAYSVSHDLRAPLRSIDGFSQALLETCGETLDLKGTRYLNHIREAAQDMGQLIDAMLTLSRVTRRDMTHESVNISLMAQATVEKLRDADPERHVSVVIGQDLVVDGDSQLLHVVIENLLNNAWKFTRNRDDSRIEFGVAGNDVSRTYFVRDNGAGFDMAYVDKLFAPFQRLHHTREFEGTGIGLATIQRIIHRHGGRVWAEGAVDEGATIFFTLDSTELAPAMAA